MEKRPLNVIAREIKATWSQIGNGVSPYAKPYLDAMMELDSVDQAYYAEDGRTQVMYFISNARSFRGADAKRLKAELKALL
jgi:hypothetical protein